MAQIFGIATARQTKTTNPPVRGKNTLSETITGLVTKRWGTFETVQIKGDPLPGMYRGTLSDAEDWRPSAEEELA
jgi:hypothetical protein